MRLILSSLLFSLWTISILLCQETSFRKYKEDKTNAITAYSGGLPFNSSNKVNYFNFYSSEKKKEKIYDQKETDLRPTFNNGKYYLFLKEFPVILNNDYHFGEVINGYFKLILYLKTDKGDIIKITSTKKAPAGITYSKTDFKEFKFFLTKDEFLKMYSANKIEVDFTASDKNDFENFPFTFDYIDLTGYRDFVKGMEWMKE